MIAPDWFLVIGINLALALYGLLFVRSMLRRPFKGAIAYLTVAALALTLNAKDIRAQEYPPCDPNILTAGALCMDPGDPQLYVFNGVNEAGEPQYGDGILVEPTTIEPEVAAPIVSVQQPPVEATQTPRIERVYIARDNRGNEPISEVGLNEKFFTCMIYISPEEGNMGQLVLTASTPNGEWDRGNGNIPGPFALPRTETPKTQCVDQNISRLAPGRTVRAEGTINGGGLTTTEVPIKRR